MLYWVWYSTSKYEPFAMETLDSERDVEAFLNRYAGNPDFKFQVIHGTEVKFVPVSVATQFVRSN